mmetsp:Transcript_2209/g.4468  ORF Transcript_2209/g.4468 Transcript_2209/m.4468 type:complete len:84 (-) Transcript_2209:261-512(-)
MHTKENAMTTSGNPIERQCFENSSLADVKFQNPLQLKPNITAQCAVGVGSPAVEVKSDPQSHFIEKASWRAAENKSNDDGAIF